MTEKSKYCNEVIKKHFNKELVMTEEDNEDFENSTKYWIYDNDYIDDNVKVRDHCHIIGKYKGSEHRHCNTNFTLNYKNTIVFHNLKDYGSYLIM